MTEIVKADDLGTDALAAIVRDEIQQARKCWSNALDHAMNAGDALITVQPKVAERGINWKKWLRENCSAAPSTAGLYMQLARHRDQIEAERLRGVELSLRAARRLISDVRDGAGDDAAAVEGDDADVEGEGEDATDNSAAPETLVDHWRRAPDELAALLDAAGVANILAAMSEEIRKQLRARLPAPKRKSDKPFKKTLNLHARERDHGFRH